MAGVSIQIGKAAQGFQWDLANRIAVATGRARHRYDAHGRRAMIEKLTPAGAATGERTSGVTPVDPNAIFGNGFEDFGLPPTGPVDRTTYHYLGRALVGRKDTSAANVTSVAYLHTDVLGSVVAETNAAQVVTRRTTYQPFGLPGGNVAAGPGYTGHVFDPALGLTYMQGRYYDPDVGRFLSMDPNPPSLADGMDFNRYSYVRNNPYRAVDPDGHVVETLWDVANVGMGIVSFGANVSIGNWSGAAYDVVGIVVDVGATIVPGVPGGAATGIKTVRAAEAAIEAASAAKKLENAADAATGAAKAEGELVDLASSSRREHILDGDLTGGGHRPGTGLPGASEFPGDWSDDKIMNAISDVATSPDSIRSIGRGGRETVEGVSDGIKIRVIRDKDGSIVTGFPLELPRNPR